MKIRKLSPKVVGTEALSGAEVIGGMILGKLAEKMVGTDSLIVNAGMAVTGLAVATFVDDPHVNAIGKGLIVYGTLKTLSTIAKDVVPVGVSGLGFTAPEGVRKFIKENLPTLGQVEPERAFANIAGYNQYGAVGSLELPELSGGTNDNNPAVLAGLSAAI